MLSLLIILFFIILIDIVIIGLFFSRITINFQDCNVYSNNGIKNVVIDKMQIFIKIYLFNKIQIANIRLYKKYFKIYGIKIFYSKFFKLKKETIIKIIKFIKLTIGDNRLKIKYLEPNIDSFKMNLTICTENAALTSIVTSMISSIIAIVLNRNIKKYDKEKYYYKVNPIYLNVNAFKFEFKSNIDFYAMNIIVFMYDFIRIKNNKYKKKQFKKKDYGIWLRKLKKVFSPTGEYSKVKF